MKVETRRIFIGDLPENIKESDLTEKFSQYGRVSSVEIKQRKELGPRNESLCFAFVSLEVDDSSLQRCFKDFNNKTFKGQRIELQMAKESFLARLNKEREEAKSKEDTKERAEYNGVANDISINFSTSTIRKKTDVNSDNIKKQKIDVSNAKLKTNDDAIDVPEVVMRDSQNSRVQGKLKIESVGYEPIIKIEKPKPKSKDPKRAEADSKRIKSMIEMKKGYLQQKLLIRNALSRIDVKPVNKIVFDDVQNSEEPVYKSDTKKSKLFDDEDADENVNYNFEVKEQFQGKKGQKLLELQSRYKKDERFTLSSKFLEDDDNEDGNTDNVVENRNDEKQEQLMILEEVLGHKIKSKENKTEDEKKKQKTMLRFDPAHPDHAKYEVKSEVMSMTKKKKRKMPEVIEEKETMPVVSKDKFYEIAEDLKDALNVKESFSLLDTFGKVHGNDKNVTDIADENIQVIKAKRHSKLGGESNPFKYDSSDDDSDSDGNKQDEEIDVQSKELVDVEKNLNLGPGRLWTEPFFFRNDDSRLQEGLDFIRKVQAEEATEFSKVRRDLVEIVKAKVKNNQRRNRPFKKKLGGKKMLRIKKAMKR